MVPVVVAKILIAEHLADGTTQLIRLSLSSIANVVWYHDTK